jgi:hypothetical protein
MIRPTIVQLVIALILLGTGNQASWGQQLGCFSTARPVERNSWRLIRQATFDTRQQTGICSPQSACASSVSFLAVPSDPAHKNVCVRVFAANPTQDLSGSVQP